MMSSSNYSTGYDDMTAEFLSSKPTYLAVDKLPMSAQDRAIAEAQERRQDLLKQMKQVEDRTLDSSKRSIGMLVESEKVGVETAEDMTRQREQLQTTENRLDDINYTLKDTQKNINGIKSVFSSLKQWWSAPKKKGADSEVDKPSFSISSSSSGSNITKDLSSAVQTSQFMVDSSSKSSSHPALRLRGLEEEEDDDDDNLDDFGERSKKVNKQLDADLDEMSSGLSRLACLAKGLGTEIHDQNQMLDRIQDKADKADVNLGSQNKQIQRILKK